MTIDQAVKITDFEKAYIEVTLSKCKDSVVIWKNNNVLGDCNADVIGKYSYLIPSSILNDELKFDKADKITGIAEKYGRGINGGGVRCVNINGYQVKGIGQTPLVGDGVNLWHSYGGFSIVEAVVEIIMDDVSDKILPLGTVRCVALIGFGDKKNALRPNAGEHDRGKGALTVREICFRPSHFLPSPKFKPCASFSHLFVSDEKRLKSVFEKINEEGSSSLEFTELLNKFAFNCGVQFAAARVNRLYHASLSSSNIALDGRWIDLTTTSLVDSNSNYHNGGAFQCFEKEPLAPVEVICDIVQTYNRFQDGKLKEESFLQIYHKSLNDSLRAEINRFFYLSEESNVLDDIFLENFLSVVSPASSVRTSLASKNFEEDRFLVYLLSIFKKIKAKKDVNDSLTNLGESFVSLVKQHFNELTKDECISVVCLKIIFRQLFSRYFDRYSLEIFLSENTEQSRFSIQNFLDSSLKTSNSLFGNNQCFLKVLHLFGVDVVFEPKSMQLSYYKGEDLILHSKVQEFPAAICRIVDLHHIDENRVKRDFERLAKYRCF